MSTVADDFVATATPNSENDESTISDLSPNTHQIDAHIQTLTTDTPSGFDPLIHAVDKTTGQPKRRGDGSFALKRGRKTGAGATHASTVPRGTNADAPGVSRETDSSAQQQDTQAKPQETPKISNEEAARQACNLVIGACVTLLGPEWQPESKDEGKFLVTSVKNYFDAKGQIQLSPEWGLVFAVAAYSLPRLRHENTRMKLSRAFNRAKEIVGGVKTLFKRG